MSLGGPAYESSLSIKHSQQPPKTIELSRADSGLIFRFVITI